jgi:hypothetical protein
MAIRLLFGFQFPNHRDSHATSLTLDRIAGYLQ